MRLYVLRFVHINLVSNMILKTMECKIKMGLWCYTIKFSKTISQALGFNSYKNIPIFFSLFTNIFPMCFGCSFSKKKRYNFVFICILHLISA